MQQSRSHQLQLCQSIWIVWYSNPNNELEKPLCDILVYDESNGHWLDPANDFEEVGYLDVIGPSSEKIYMMKQLLTSSTVQQQ